MGRLSDEFKQELKDLGVAERSRSASHKAPRGYSRTGLKIDNYMENVEDFHLVTPFFYDKKRIFWLWNTQEYKYEITDETTILTLIDEELSFAGQTVSSGKKNNYLEAFRRVGRKNIPEEAPTHWIQFRDKIIDLKTSNEFEADPKYFICNPIPWDLGPTEETPVMDKLFTEWNSEHVKTMYEVIAYCCLPDYPIHSLFAFIGAGRNGKSKFLELINRFIGRTNVTSTELDTLLDNRFESAKLYKKLVCIMGETNFNVINKASLLKKLTGQDLIGYEFKNKDPFDDYNYAKIIIASNSLPISTDTSEGFYRRWMIIEFNNTFQEGHNILDIVPQQEYENLAKKSFRILQELVKRGSFTHQGTIDKRKENYIKASNPITIFLKEKCEFEETHYIKSKDMFNAYHSWLIKHKRRPVKKKEFNNVLAEEGYHSEKINKYDYDAQELRSTYWIEGLRLIK